MVAAVTAAATTTAAAAAAATGETVQRIGIGILVGDSVKKFSFEVEKGAESGVAEQPDVGGGGGCGHGEGRPSDSADHAVAITRCGTEKKVM